MQCTSPGMTYTSQPTWPALLGGTVTESQNPDSRHFPQVTWKNVGPAGGPSLWASGTPALGSCNYGKATDGNVYVYQVTTVTGATSAEPTWPAAIGATVTQGSVTWTNIGPLANLSARTLAVAINGLIPANEVSTVQSGPGTQGQIPALNSAGLVDPSLLYTSWVAITSGEMGTNWTAGPDLAYQIISGMVFLRGSATYTGSSTSSLVVFTVGAIAPAHQRVCLCSMSAGAAQPVGNALSYENVRQCVIATSTGAVSITVLDTTPSNATASFDGVQFSL